MRDIYSCIAPLFRLRSPTTTSPSEFHSISPHQLPLRQLPKAVNMDVEGLGLEGFPWWVPKIDWISRCRKNIKFIQAECIYILLKFALSKDFFF